jgi:hypothetical protein
MYMDDLPFLLTRRACTRYARVRDYYLASTEGPWGQAMFDRRMPFGRHRGKLLRDVPTAYLAWMLRTCDLDPLLKRDAQVELESRRTTAHTPWPNKPPPTDWSAVITKWYRGLIMDYHPDRGGSHEAMVAINDAAERLRKLVG